VRPPHVPDTLVSGGGAHFDGYECDDYVRIRAVHDNGIELHGTPQNPQAAGSKARIQTGIKIGKNFLTTGDTHARRRQKLKENNKDFEGFSVSPW
jgi:hypothetical protein